MTVPFGTLFYCHTPERLRGLTSGGPIRPGITFAAAVGFHGRNFIGRIRRLDFRLRRGLGLDFRLGRGGRGFDVGHDDHLLARNQRDLALDVQRNHRSPGRFVVRTRRST
ncbi:hypothetical protein BREVUG8_110566 [Brevundimonas sp. G8]|nr:hypothetical protein BREVUG8_110566 [Brevundimonas sp. G8]